MAKEKQEPYEFLSNLVLALMNADRIFSNSFFISEFAVSPKTLGEIRRGEDMCIYQYVRVIRCMTKYLHLIGGRYGSAPFLRNLSADRMGGSDALGWSEIVISTGNRAFFYSFCLISFFILFFLYLCFHIEKHREYLTYLFI